MRKTIARVNKTTSCFIEKIKKIDKPLARLLKKKRHRTRINKVSNGKEEFQQTMQKYRGS